MLWAKSMSKFDCPISNLPNKLNPMANALSRGPHVNAFMILYHHQDLIKMVDYYTHDDGFAAIYTKIAQGKDVPLYFLKDGFIMY